MRSATCSWTRVIYSSKGEHVEIRGTGSVWEVRGRGRIVARREAKDAARMAARAWAWDNLEKDTWTEVAL